MYHEVKVQFPEMVWVYSDNIVPYLVISYYAILCHYNKTLFWYYIPKYSKSGQYNLRTWHSLTIFCPIPEMCKIFLPIYWYYMEISWHYNNKSGRYIPSISNVHILPLKCYTLAWKLRDMLECFLSLLWKVVISKKNKSIAQIDFIIKRSSKL